MDNEVLQWMATTSAMAYQQVITEGKFLLWSSLVPLLVAVFITMTVREGRTTLDDYGGTRTTSKRTAHFARLFSWVIAFCIFFMIGQAGMQRLLNPRPYVIEKIADTTPQKEGGEECGTENDECTSCIYRGEKK